MSKKRTIGQLLRHLREERGLSQTETSGALTRETGFYLDPRVLSMYELDRRTPSAGMLYRLFKVLHPKLADDDAKNLIAELLINKDSGAK